MSNFDNIANVAKMYNFSNASSFALLRTNHIASEAKINHHRINGRCGLYIVI